MRPVYTVLLLIAGVIIGAGGFAAYAEYGRSTAVTTFKECVKANGSQMTAMEPPTCVTRDGKSFTDAAPTPAARIPADWVRTDSAVLGITFSLPPYYALADMSGRESDGDSGKQYCMVFLRTASLRIVPKAYAGAGPCSGDFAVGSVTPDYSAGRGGGFGDMTGYVKKNGSYYYRFLDSVSDQPLPASVVREVTNENGVTYLLVKGSDTEYDVGGTTETRPMMGTPGTGYIGALVNLAGGRYKGFGIQMKIGKSGDTETFERILSTLAYAEPASPAPSGSRPPEGFTCPPSEWVDCMPGPANEGIRWECTETFLSWAKTNCPGFKGAAY